MRRSYLYQLILVLVVVSETGLTVTLFQCFGRSLAFTQPCQKSRLSQEIVAFT